VSHWRLVGAAAVILTALVGSPALADPILGTTNALGNANPPTVEAWLETLLGGQDVRLVYDYQAPKDSGFTSLTLDPHVNWDYAVVKYAKNYTAYSDSPNDNVIVVGVPYPLSNGVSNIRFFAVPEPSALLLLAAGLVAATPFVRSLRRRV
jgi:PEP-CTERM motif-containing protein